MSPGASVTVVIPTHNRSELLMRTLDSVLRQRDVDVEVVVVDDGGSDGTTTALRKLELDNLRVIRHESSKGVSAARNAGLAAATAGLVAFVDDDDIWAPEKLSAQTRALQDLSTARWACVGALHVDSNLGVTRRALPPASGDVSDVMLTSNVIPGGGSGVLAETELARAVGGFDEQISILADWDFNLRLALRSPVAAVNRPLLGYYVHTDSMYHDPSGVVRELHYLEGKHGDRGFRFDRGSWFTDLARMSRQLGDNRGALDLLRQGGSRRILREAVRRLRRAVLPAREAPVAIPRSWDEPSVAWLGRYSEGAWRADWT